MAERTWVAELIRIIREALTAGLKSAETTRERDSGRPTSRSTTSRSRTSKTGRTGASRTGASGETAREASTTRATSTADPSKLSLTYDPADDELPDPGEIVWTWVPYEEDDGRGKDRPVLVIARRRGTSRLVGLMLTSKDHDRDKADERRYGRYWMDIGSGEWDSQRRPSEVRLDRLIDVDPQAVRRETALDRERFDQVAAAFRTLHEK